MIGRTLLAVASLLSLAVPTGAHDLEFCGPSNDSTQVVVDWLPGGPVVGAKWDGSRTVTTLALCNARGRAVRAFQARPADASTNGRMELRASAVIAAAVRSERRFSMQDVVGLLAAKGIEAEVVTYPRDGCLCDREDRTFVTLDLPYGDASEGN